MIAATLAYDAAHKPAEQVAGGYDDEDALWDTAATMPDEWDIALAEANSEVEE